MPALQACTCLATASAAQAAAAGRSTTTRGTTAPRAAGMGARQIMMLHLQSPCSTVVQASTCTQVLVLALLVLVGCITAGVGPVGEAGGGGWGLVH